MTEIAGLEAKLAQATLEHDTLALMNQVPTRPFSFLLCACQCVRQVLTLAWISASGRGEQRGTGAGPSAPCFHPPPPDIGNASARAREAAPRGSSDAALVDGLHASCSAFDTSLPRTQTASTGGEGAQGLCSVVRLSFAALDGGQARGGGGTQLPRRPLAFCVRSSLGVRAAVCASVPSRCCATAQDAGLCLLLRFSLACCCSSRASCPCYLLLCLSRLSVAMRPAMPTMHAPGCGQKAWLAYTLTAWRQYVDNEVKRRAGLGRIGVRAQRRAVGQALSRWAAFSYDAACARQSEIVLRFRLDPSAPCVLACHDAARACSEMMVTQTAHASAGPERAGAPESAAFGGIAGGPASTARHVPRPRNHHGAQLPGGSHTAPRGLESTAARATPTCAQFPRLGCSP